MRAGLSTIQQTLTPEAAAVLTHSIAEAARRNHGQTTPLHVASVLLSSPSSLLRQACLRSHPTSSHPLQCRALELCFSVALDRLPSNSSNSNSSDGPPPAQPQPPDPPISNALMAALKRAQAHQRRGCPEQQNQPLLAVKVELDQLVVSILDDPSVSRVMREASFSSPAVKSTIENSLHSAAPNSPSLPTTTVRPATTTTSTNNNTPIVARNNLYANPRLQQRAGDEVRKVLEILMRTKKRNPVLVADSDPGAVMREVLLKIERREFGVGEVPLALRSATVVSFDKELAAADKTQILPKIQELGASIDTQFRSACGGGVILDLGDLKWLVESGGGGQTQQPPPQQQQQQVVSEVGRAAVAEMGRILGRFGDGGGGGLVWVVGTATCATYLRCQVYHPTMESEWDLQAVPISPRSPLPGLFPRLGCNGNGILSSSVEALAPPKGFPSIVATPAPLRWPPPEKSSDAAAAQKPALCPLCMDSYERELAKLVATELDKSSSDSRSEARPPLPKWLQMATPADGNPPPDHQLQTKEHEQKWKQRTVELLKRWRETCSRLHPAAPRQHSHPRLTISQPFPPIQLRTTRLGGPVLSPLERPKSPPGSPVKTDLVLGHSEAHPASPLERAHRKRIKDFPGCKQDNLSDHRSVKFQIPDADSLKRIFKGLLDKVGWQPEAASAVAGAVMQCKSGNGKRRGVAAKADTWLLFVGPDKVGKRKMAHALSELVFGAGPVTVRVGSPAGSDGDDGGESVNFRGKTSMDRAAEAVRQNPFSLIVLEDVDRADVVVRSTIRRAMERGRLPDSYGREVSLGSAIFVLTASWLPDELKNSQDLNTLLEAESRILDTASSGQQLELLVEGKPGKRQADWLLESDSRPTKPRKDPTGLSLSLDLNLAAGGGDDDNGEGSWNSSDLTVDHEQYHGRLSIKHLAAPAPAATELIDLVDQAIAFKPVDFGPLRRRILESVSTKYASIMGAGGPIRVDDGVIDQLVGGVWLGGQVFDEWTERVLAPGIEKLRGNSAVEEGAAVRLSAVKGAARPRRISGEWLPETVTVRCDG